MSWPMSTSGAIIDKRVQQLAVHVWQRRTGPVEPWRVRRTGAIVGVLTYRLC
jgi:hypothetical protein